MLSLCVSLFLAGFLVLNDLQVCAAFSLPFRHLLKFVSLFNLIASFHTSVS